MAFDFKKEYKEFYMPKNVPEIVDVPSANYIAVRGRGDPNEPEDDRLFYWDANLPRHDWKTGETLTLTAHDKALGAWTRA